MNANHAAYLLLGVFGSTIAVQQAMAEDQPEQLQEVVVTAQKRSENLQNVPIAVTALSKQDLQLSGVQTSLDLTSVVPGLNMVAALGDFVQPRIRGIGTAGSGPGIENEVATYVDGVYIANMSSALTSLNNVSQVAVLKGPQGTLFGRNATGGAIQITTNTPQQDLSAVFHATGGNLDTFGGDLYVTGGLSSAVAADLAVYYYDQRHGFGINIPTGEDVERGSTFAARTKWLITPFETTTITAALDYSSVQSIQPAIHTTSLNAAGQSPPSDPFDINNNFIPHSSNRQYGGSVTVRQEAGPVALVSISAWRESQYSSFFDEDASSIPQGLFPFSATNLRLPELDKQFSQEFQVLSNTSGKLTWVAGLYYFWWYSAYDSAVTTIETFPFGVPPFPNANAVLSSAQTTNSWAGYAQGTYEVLPDTHLTVGARYTTERRGISASNNIEIIGTPVTFPAEIPYTDHTSFSKTTDRISLDYRLSPQLLAYVSYDEGFKSGAFAPTSFPASVLRPEVIKASELGVKSDLFDHRLRLNIAGFYYDYNNVQVTELYNGDMFVYNGKKAYVSGMDADLEARVTDGLSLNAGVSVLHDHYGYFPNAFVSIPQAGGGNLIAPTITGNVTDHKLQQTPDWTVNFGPRYTLPSPIGKFTASASYYYNAGWYGDPENRVHQGGYSLFGASLLWSAKDGHLDAQLWGRNLANKAYAVQYTAVNSGDNAVYAPGRTFGITVGYRL